MPSPKVWNTYGIVCNTRKDVKIIYISCTIRADPTSFLGSIFLVFVLELNFSGKEACSSYSLLSCGRKTMGFQN